MNTSRGETIAETLIALLISSVGLMMLASMIAAGARLISESRQKYAAYYEKNNIVAEQADDGAAMTVTISPAAVGDADTIKTTEVEVIGFRNETMERTPVISYRSELSSGDEPGGGTP